MTDINLINLRCLEPDEKRSYYELWNKDRSNDIHYFQYALLLSSSDKTTDRTEAITYFNSMLNNKSYRRDALYSLALCHYTLKEYDTALSFCEELYRDEPDNSQLKSLHKAILSKHKKTEQESRDLQESIGIAVGIGAAFFAAGVGLALALRKR